MIDKRFDFIMELFAFIQKPKLNYQKSLKPKLFEKIKKNKP